MCLVQNDNKIKFKNNGLCTFVKCAVSYSSKNNRRNYFEKEINYNIKILIYRYRACLWFRREECSKNG